MNNDEATGAILVILDVSGSMPKEALLHYAAQLMERGIPIIFSSDHDGHRWQQATDISSINGFGGDDGTCERLQRGLDWAHAHIKGGPFTDIWWVTDGQFPPLKAWPDDGPRVTLALMPMFPPPEHLGLPYFSLAEKFLNEEVPQADAAAQRPRHRM